MDDSHVISYYKNGLYMGAAYKIPSRYEDRAYLIIIF